MKTSIDYEQPSFFLIVLFSCHVALQLCYSVLLAGWFSPHMTDFEEKYDTVHTLNWS